MRIESLVKVAVAGAASLMIASGALAADAKPADPQQCLMCHGGTLEAVADKTKNWKTEFGDPVQPHVYIDGAAAKPHQGKKVLPDCLSCHDAHPMPLPAGYKHKTPTLSSCYGCHHLENFQKCSSNGCHEKH